MLYIQIRPCHDVDDDDMFDCYERHEIFLVPTTVVENSLEWSARRLEGILLLQASDDLTNFKRSFYDHEVYPCDLEMGNCDAGTSDAEQCYAFTIIECCTSWNSRLGDSRYSDVTDSMGGRVKTRVVRVTEDVNFTNPDTQNWLNSIVNDPKSGHIFLFNSQPCTAGSSFQQENARIYPTGHARRMEKHMKLFNEIFDAFEELASLVLSPKIAGDVIQEWPTENTLWNDPRVRMFHDQIGSQKTDFFGCELGLKSRTYGRLKKRWTMRATFPQIRNEFGRKVCCKNHKHTRIHGEDTAYSANYPWEMCRLIHKACFDRAEEQKLQRICAIMPRKDALRRLIRCDTSENADIDDGYESERERQMIKPRIIHDDVPTNNHEFTIASTMIIDDS